VSPLLWPVLDLVVNRGVEKNRILHGGRVVVLVTLRGREGEKRKRERKRRVSPNTGEASGG